MCDDNNANWHQELNHTKIQVSDAESHLIEALQTCNKWSIVTTFKSIIHFTRLFQGFVFVVTNTGDLQAHLSRLQHYFVHIGSAHHSTRVLIFVTGKHRAHAVARSVLTFLYTHHVYDAVVLVQDTSPHTVNAFTWFPYKPPSGNCSHLEEVVLIDTWIENLNGGNFVKNSNIFKKTKP
jgi:hypothetical protein